MIRKRSLLIAIALLIFTQQLCAHDSEEIIELFKSFLLDPPAREQYSEENQITYYDKKRRLWAWKNLRKYSFGGSKSQRGVSAYTMISGATAELLFFALDFFYANNIQYTFQITKAHKESYYQLLKEKSELSYKESDIRHVDTEVKCKKEDIPHDRPIDWDYCCDQRENGNPADAWGRVFGPYATAEPICCGS